MAVRCRMAFCTFFLLFTFYTAAAAENASDGQALLALQAAVGRLAGLRWNASDPSYCGWLGVTCRGVNVVSLRLPASLLAGVIPAGTLGNLTFLRTLSLRLNALSGNLPSDLARCSRLRSLYLQGNRLTGEFPTSVLALHGLVRLNLAGNSFSGPVPTALSGLSRLATLFLENNTFSGVIPPLHLPDITQFNVSFNKGLNGSVPASFQSMPADAFLGTSLCGTPLPLCPSKPHNSPLPVARGGPDTENETGGSAGGGKSLSGGAITGIIVGSSLGFLFLTFFILLLFRRGNRTRSPELAGTVKPADTDTPTREKPSTGGPTHPPPAPTAGYGTGSGMLCKKLVFFGGMEEFDLEELLRASAEVLGKGTFGTAYKAILENGAVVAVKRLRDVELTEAEFRQRAEAIGEMNHPSLVPLRAYYYSKDEKLLVYDYFPGGSLSALLHGNRGAGRPTLDWVDRSRIALEVASAIDQIHSLIPETSSHGNIKSSNVLMDNRNSKDARLSDHGLVHLVRPSSFPNSRNAGYRAPEVTSARTASQKADVYSFGVLLLELLTGKAPNVDDGNVELPGWVRSVRSEEWTTEVLDPELAREENAVEEMARLLQVAVDCTAEHSDERPAMFDVVRRIAAIRK